MAKRWPTPVAWTKTLSPTTKSTVSSSDGLVFFAHHCQPELLSGAPCRPQREAPDASPLKTTRRLALSAPAHERDPAPIFAKMTKVKVSLLRTKGALQLSPTKQAFLFIPPPPLPQHRRTLAFKFPQLNYCAFITSLDENNAHLKVIPGAPPTRIFFNFFL